MKTLKQLLTPILLATMMLAPLAGLKARNPPPAGGGLGSVPLGKTRPYSRHPSREALKWADKELKRMSLEEKIGQLIAVGLNATFLNQDSEAFKDLRHQVVDNHVGGIILFRGPVYESVVLVNRMQELAKYPLLISADLEAGAGMRFDDTVNFPWNMAVGATGNPDYARRQGELTAREARALGIQQIYAPVADVNNNAANPVINVRSYGEDPAEVAKLVGAFVEGAQLAGVMATAKHFPGHGDTATDSHRGLPEIDVTRERLNSVELVPFRAAVSAGVGAVMDGHIGLPLIDPTAITPLPRDVKLKPIETEQEVVVENGTMPTTLSPVMNGILRRELGFDGLIVTDAMSMSGLTLYFTQEEASVRALEAGADLLLKPADTDAAFRGVRAAVKSGRLTEERIEDSARKVLAAKYDLGLTAQRITPLGEIDRVVGGKDTLKLAEEIAEHALTLVRNDAQLLPLNLPPNATIFNLAITNGDDRLFITQPFVAAFARAGRKVVTIVLDDRSSAAEVNKALDLAGRADLVIASLYGRVRSGQARSVGLPEPGARALETLIDRKTALIGISFGNPYLLVSFPKLQTYLVAYGDMQSLQEAGAAALLGQNDITGRLPISLPGLYPRGTGIQMKARPLKMMVRHVSLSIALIALLAQTVAAQLPPTAPAAAGMSAERLARMDQVIQSSIDKKDLPGAVVLVARHGRIAWRKAYGSRAVEPEREAMTADTIFDLASLTKIVATATSIMILVEEGKVRLSDPAVQFIPEMKGGGRDAITIEQLLTHTAGFAPDFDLRERWTGYDEAIKRLYREPLRNSPGTRFVYSDINYIALGEVVHRVSGQPLDEFARRNIFVPLGMRDTGFNPDARLKSRIAPTEKRRGQMSYLGDSGADAGSQGEQWLRGQVHDPTSFRMGGVAGHAGLFSTADDLAIFCQMISNGGSYHGARILSPMAVETMTRPRAIAENGSARGLGWDIATTFSTNKGDLFPLGSFGHTGFTGTSMWLDPASDSFVVFLSNRVHPDGKGDVASLRGKVASIVAGSIIDTTVAKAREESAGAAAQVLSSIARLNSNSSRANGNPNPVADAQVLTGIDVLERDGFKQLAGLRIGLVTNQTGRDRAGHSTIDVLFKAPGVKLVALFSPEHGIRGLADEKVSDTKDEQTGLPIYSLYGETRRPKPEQLKDLDALVYDIQDIGVRFYTYISTLGYVLEEAGKARLPVFVLDRPNPINGNDVEGPIADADKLSFTAYHTLPVRHGLTIGELARLYNDERKIGADLRVIKMEGWRRTMWFDASGLVWINPSPNMRSLTEAALYPGVGLLETTNLSVGRGTDTPFEVIGAPWLDGPKLASYLNGRKIPGVRFIPIRFTPKSSALKNEECGGLNLVITDRSQFQSVTAGMEIAVALHRLFPTDWKVDAYSRLLVNADTLERLKRGDSVEDIVRSWTTALESFNRTRRKYLLYD